MERLRRSIFAMLFLLFIGGSFGACGMGGTEVGNPRPGVPADGEAEPTFGPDAPLATPAAVEFDEANLE